MAHPRRALREAYGFEFPPDLFAFWAFASKKGVFETLADDLGMRLCGPFNVLGGGTLPRDRDRFEADPPEFYTVADGDTDGLHWGYVLHDPGTSPGHVAHFYARDGFPIAIDGPSLFDALRGQLDSIERDRRSELEELRAIGEDDAELAGSLTRIATVRRAMRRVAIPKRLERPQLERLQLVACGLDEVPALVLSARKLYNLSLDNNRLEELPAAIGALRALRYLAVSKNALASLPASIGKLSKLDSLWIGGNKIAALPDSLRALELDAIGLGGNPLAKDQAERARTKQLLRRAKIFWT